MRGGKGEGGGRGRRGRETRGRRGKEERKPTLGTGVAPRRISVNFFLDGVAEGDSSLLNAVTTEVDSSAGLIRMFSPPCAVCMFCGCGCNRMVGSGSLCGEIVGDSCCVVALLAVASLVDVGGVAVRITYDCRSLLVAGNGSTVVTGEVCGVSSFGNNSTCDTSSCSISWDLRRSGDASGVGGV